MILGTIVEGHGDAKALPILLRRLGEMLAPGVSLRLLPPHRLKRGKMVIEAELRRSVELVARRVGPGMPILIVLDADKDAACSLGPRLLSWARAERSDRQIGVVLAVREFEAWFVAGAPSLAGRRGLSLGLESISDPEGIPSPKAWLDSRMHHGYTEVLDQPSFAAELDLNLARRARSFDKLMRDVARLLGVVAPPPPA